MGWRLGLRSTALSQLTADREGCCMSPKVRVLPVRRWALCLGYLITVGLFLAMGTYMLHRRTDPDFEKALDYAVCMCILIETLIFMEIARGAERIGRADDAKGRAGSG